MGTLLSTRDSTGRSRKNFIFGKEKLFFIIGSFHFSLFSFFFLKHFPDYILVFKIPSWEHFQKRSQREKKIIYCGWEVCK